MHCHLTVKTKINYIILLLFMKELMVFCWVEGSDGAGETCPRSTNPPVGPFRCGQGYTMLSIG